MAKKHRYFNRELSWVEFNARVLDEAFNRDNPILERLKFVGIVASNFDEFFMVRVAGLKRQAAANKPSTCPTGMPPARQLESIRSRVLQILESQRALYTDDISGLLEASGICLDVTDRSDLDQRRFIAEHFQNEVFPLLTPMRYETEFPFVKNLTLHLVVALRIAEGTADDTGEVVHAIVRIPESLERFVQVPHAEYAHAFIPVEKIIIENISSLFPGYSCEGSVVFRVTRDADFGVDEARDEDFVLAMEEVLANRQTGRPVRLEYGTTIDASSSALVEELRSSLGLSENDLYGMAPIVDYGSLFGLANTIDRADLSAAPWPSVLPIEFQNAEDIFETVRTADRILHHPYESFEPIVSIISRAARDPDVLAIKITLYRTSGDSPIVEALKTAAENGIQVTAFVELKARFDEERNIAWAQQLERDGVIVIHGLANLKVHAKACLIIRRELGGIRRYTHLSTGNYNDRTARLYSDIGLLTADEGIASDVANFFNAVTGYSSIPQLMHLYMAPTNLKQRMIELTQREIARCRESGTGLIVAKLNSLADTDVIDALYQASEAGVTVRLNIRGICMLVPGVKGMSEHIEVVSIVDRYLEHSRIIYFENGGESELYLSSADWMPRNLERRVELCFPVRDGENIARVVGFLETYFEDDVKARRLKPDGTYTRPRKAGSRRAQTLLYQEAVARAEAGDPAFQKEFVVRRSDAPG